MGPENEIANAIKSSAIDVYVITFPFVIFIRKIVSPDILQDRIAAGARRGRQSCMSIPQAGRNKADAVMPSRPKGE
jgi:hypothetical protein